MDLPSGSARSLEWMIIENIDCKSKVVEDKLDRRIKADEFHFSWTCGGAVNFAHTVGFDSAADTIEITHRARNRYGYATGAVKAVEWLVKQPAGFCSMDDFLGDLF